MAIRIFLSPDMCAYCFNTEVVRFFCGIFTVSVVVYHNWSMSNVIEFLHEFFDPGEGYFVGPEAVAEAFEGVEELPTLLQQAIAARAYGLSRQEFAERLGRSLDDDEVKRAYGSVGRALQGAMPGAWANHYGFRFPGLWGQMRED